MADQTTQQHSKRRKNIMFAFSIVFCLVVLYLCTVSGAASVSIGDASRVLLNKLFHLPVDISDISKGSITIIWNVRVPRIILGFIAGAALAASGAGYQGIFKNPMADPFVLGVSSGAALGAAIGIILNFQAGIAGFTGTTILAFLGAFLTIGTVYGISRVGKKVPVATLLLSGVAISSTLSSVMSLLMMINKQSMDQIMFWTMGSLNGKGWNQIVTVLPWVMLGLILLYVNARELDIMLLGEDTATQLGVNVEGLKRKILIASSLITAAVISVTGIIGFVGLVVPHVVRIFTGPKHQRLIPVALLFGGTFLIICDTAARTLSTAEIPVGIITAICGGPFFLYLLRKTKKGGSAS